MWRTFKCFHKFRQILTRNIGRVKVQMIFILLSYSVIFSVVSRFSSSEALDVCSDEF